MLEENACCVPGGMHILFSDFPCRKDEPVRSLEVAQISEIETAMTFSLTFVDVVKDFVAFICIQLKLCTFSRSSFRNTKGQMGVM